MASNATNGNNSLGLYNFLNERMYGLLANEELKKFMKEYSNFLKTFLSSSTAGAARYSKTEFIRLSKQIYDRLSELLGEAVNSNTINRSYTVPDNYNAGSFGPITVANSAIVTVPSGSIWTVI